MTGPPHHSIREPHSVERLSHTFSRSLSAADLVEPLASLDGDRDVALAAELIKTLGVTVIGVRRNGLVTGWVCPDDLTSGTLIECAHIFAQNEVLDETAGLDAVLNAFNSVDHVFIEWRGVIAAVITRRDLQKPPLRMWLFGAITILDSNLTWAIEELYPEDSWRSLISAGRLKKATTLQAERRRRASPCRLVDCLQITDKTSIVLKDSASLAALGLKSRNEADHLIGNLEKLRNHLAHAQELETYHLNIAARLASFIQSILGAEGVQRIVATRREQPLEIPVS